jgi:glycosyltransferase involved in cell wall biosynthesis
MHWKIMYPAAARKYDCVITVSEAEKKNYVKYIRVPEGKFRTINLAADKRFRIINNKEKLQEVKTKYSLPEQFLLFVGRILPVKNIETTIKGYHLAKKRKGIKQKLVIVGAKTWYYDAIESLIAKLDLEEDVIFTGPIFDDLPIIYNLADIFLFPSYYESFGAVVLEAMACGTPVIASNTGGIPEVAGDSAILISAMNINQLADGIIKLISSENLRKSLIEKGLERTKKFSWEICARETLEVYEQFG